MANSKTIIFIHGLHENANCWNAWVTYFEGLGYSCYAPNYPYHEGAPKELRENCNPNLATTKLRHVVQHYENFIDIMQIKLPILVGHSMGGLVVQKLIAKGKGGLGICITSAPPKGVLTFAWSFVKSNIGIINPFKGNSLYCATKYWFHYAICNTLTREESDEIYQKAVVSESRNIPRSSRFSDGYINFKRPHNPLLFISAEKDHIIPVSLNKKNVAAYTNENSITHFKEFKNKSHCICVQEGWEVVADYIDNWIRAYAFFINE